MSRSKAVYYSTPHTRTISRETCTSSTLWTSLPNLRSISHRRGCNSFVVMVCTPRGSRATGRAWPTFYSGRHQVGRAKLTRPPPPHPTGRGAERCLQRRPTLQTRVNVAMRGPACSLGSTKSTHLFAPAAELGLTWVRGRAGNRAPVGWSGLAFRVGLPRGRE